MPETAYRGKLSSFSEPDGSLPGQVSPSHVGRMIERDEVEPGSI